MKGTAEVYPINSTVCLLSEEVEGGWIEYVPRLPPTRGVESGPTLLAIADRARVSN